jgi:hypothetical protein
LKCMGREGIYKKNEQSCSILEKLQAILFRKRKARSIFL